MRSLSEKELDQVRETLTAGLSLVYEQISHALLMAKAHHQAGIRVMGDYHERQAENARDWCRTARTLYRQLDQLPRCSSGIRRPAPAPVPLPRTAPDEQPSTTT